MIRCLLNALDAFEKGKISTLGAINDTSCLGIDLPDNRGLKGGEYTWLYNSDSIIHCYVCDSGDGFKMYNPGDNLWYVDTADADMQHGIPRLYFSQNTKDVECAMSRQMTWKERDIDISYFSDELGSMANSHMIVHKGESGIDYLDGFTLETIPASGDKTEFYNACAAFPACGAAEINFYADSPYTLWDFDEEMRRTKHEVYATSLEFTGEGLPEKLEKLAIVRPDVPSKSGGKGNTEPADYRNLVAYLGEKEDAEPGADDKDKYEDAVTICTKHDDDETCEIDFVEGSDKDPDVGDMAYSDIDELKPGFYKPSDYSKFYTKEHYPDNEKREKAIAAAKWGVYKQTDLKYQVKCVRKVVREEDKEKDEEGSDNANNDTNDKKTKTKYKYTTEDCDIALSNTTYSAINRRLYKDRAWSHDEYCRIPVRGCSGFAYYIKNVKASDFFGPSFGMITFVPNNTKIETDLALFPRTTIRIVGLVPKELAGKIEGSAPQGYKFLAKVPSIGNNVLSKQADSSSNFGYKWHFSVVVLDVDGSTVKMDGDKGILFKEIASFERTEDGDLETKDGRFRIFGRPDRSSSVYSNSINGKHGEGTTGASLAFSGKRTYTQAKGGIYDVKADKYFCMESANVSIKPDPSSSKKVNVLQKTATLDISNKVHTLQLHFVKRFQANRMYGMFFMPTLGLIRKMSIDFNNSKDVTTKLKGFSNRLYRLHMWSKFVEAVMAGRYVADAGEVYTFEQDDDGDGGKWKKKPGKYKKFDFGLLTADRPPVYYANILNSDVIDLVAKEVVAAASHFYVKDEDKKVPIRKFDIRVGYRDKYGRIEPSSRRLAASDPEKYEDIGQTSCPMFKNYIDTISVADIIAIGRSTLDKPHKSTAGVIDLIDDRISGLEKIAMLNNIRVFVPSLSSVAAKYVTDIASSTSFRGYKHLDKHGVLSIKGLSTLPGCFAEIYETPITVKGLKSYTWKIDIHSLGNSSCDAGWYEPGDAPGWCDHVVNIQVPRCEPPDEDGNRECKTESVAVCVSEGYGPTGNSGYCSDKDASDYADGLRWWYGNHAQDYAKNKYKVPTFWNTDNFYRGEIITENPFVTAYLYDQSENFTTVQIKEDTTKKYVVNVGTVDSSGFNNTTPHTFSSYPGDDSSDRLFEYSEHVDGCLSWKYDRNSREFHVPFIARNYTNRRRPEVDFYDITDFISLTKAQKYLGISDAFAVK